MSDDPDDDRSWMELLAGRAEPEVRGSTRHEAAWLRAALLTYRGGTPSRGCSRAGSRCRRGRGWLPPRCWCSR